MTKICSGCHKRKPLKAFHVRSARKKFGQGVQSKCKACLAKWREAHREELRAKARDYLKTEKSKAYRAIYTASIAGRAVQRKSDLARDPQKVKARAAIKDALRSGKIIRQPCTCGDPKTQAHHRKGYAPEFWLVVQWLCVKHHREAHACLTSGMTT